MRQDYKVASGLIFDDQKILLVQNRRRNGSLDWSTPGGVVDDGEQVLEALGREVVEETALSVAGWSPMLYSVDVDFVGRELTLHAEIYRAAGFAGRLHVDDPDEVVVAGKWATMPEAIDLLEQSPQWVAEPLRHALVTPDVDEPHAWHYEVTNLGADMTVTLLAGPGTAAGR